MLGEIGRKYDVRAGARARTRAGPWDQGPFLNTLLVSPGCHPPPLLVGEKANLLVKKPTCWGKGKPVGEQKQPIGEKANLLGKKPTHWKKVWRARWGPGQDPGPGPGPGTRAFFLFKLF